MAYRRKTARKSYRRAAPKKTYRRKAAPKRRVAKKRASSGTHTIRIVMVQEPGGVAGQIQPVAKPRAVKARF